MANRQHLALDREHYFATPLQLAQKIRHYLQILDNYNTFRPVYVYEIFAAIRQKMTTLDAAGMEAKIKHEEDRYQRRKSNDAAAYHALLQQYTEQLRTVLELSEAQMNSLTQFDNTSDSANGHEFEWQSTVRMLLDLRSKFLSSTLVAGEFCYPPGPFHRERPPAPQPPATTRRPEPSAPARRGPRVKTTPRKPPEAGEADVHLLLHRLRLLS
jgi:hypothetical protein